MHLDFLKNFLHHCCTKEQYQKLRYLYRRSISRCTSRLLDAFAKQATVKCNFTGPKVSIICCCFNTALDYLTSMLDSVLWQTYTNWELCLLNCSDEEHTDVEKTLCSYASQDPRIRLIRHDNYGIAENSNIAAKHATGKFLFLLDHDDLLAPTALAEMIQAATLQNADFVYADEIWMYPFGYRIRNKKDFDLNLLWHDNYINHPVLIKKTQFDEIGGFRSGFNGSQDYDLYLRLVEKTNRIVHVRKPLYVWRIHPTSFSNASVAPCIASGKKALEEHLARIGISATVLTTLDTPIFTVKKKTP